MTHELCLVQTRLYTIEKRLHGLSQCRRIGNRRLNQHHLARHIPLWPGKSADDVTQLLLGTQLLEEAGFHDLGSERCGGPVVPAVAGTLQVPGKHRIIVLDLHRV